MLIYILDEASSYRETEQPRRKDASFSRPVSRQSEGESSRESESERSPTCRNGAPNAETRLSLSGREFERAEAQPSTLTSAKKRDGVVSLDGGSVEGEEVYGGRAKGEYSSVYVRRKRNLLEVEETEGRKDEGRRAELGRRRAPLLLPAGAEGDVELTR